MCIHTGKDVWGEGLETEVPEGLNAGGCFQYEVLTSGVGLLPHCAFHAEFKPI